jgi:hypothetical protein
MFPRSIFFKFEKDPIFDDMWRLMISLNSKDNYKVVKKWNKKPSVDDIIAVKELVMRSIQVYHDAFKVPKFYLEIEGK